MFTGSGFHDERELLTSLKSGDEEAFDLLYHQHKGAIYGNLLKLVKATDIAEELLQDVFLRIWEKRQLIDTERSVKPYLYKIARNLVTDFYRQASRDKDLRAQLINAASELYNDIEDIIYLKEGNQIVQKAIADLPPQRKQIFMLCKLEGKSYAEVAELMGISISTVNDHIVKATKKIKEQLFRSSDIAFTVVAGILFLR